MINILADKNIYKIEDFTPAACQLKTYNPEEGCPSINGEKALIVRTVSQITRINLNPVPDTLSFVGTASSGSDHLDTQYLQQNGIMVEDSKGCNARSVAEYIMTCLLLWKEKTNCEHFGSVGIIGAGKTGTAVSELLQRFDIKWRAYDPPREEREPDFSSCTLEELLNCDILTFHVPLKEDGNYPTRYWLDGEKLKNHTFDLIINASRGGVVRESDLLKYHEEGKVRHYILDVWENEPDFNPKMAEQAFIATPHIAGYSEQAKINATRIICEKMCRHFNIDFTAHSYKNLPREEQLAHIKYTLKDVLSRLHPVLEYDRALRDLIAREDKPELFRLLRTDRPYRYEYPYMKVRKDLLDQFPELVTLGVKPI